MRNGIGLIASAAARAVGVVILLTAAFGTTELYAADVAGKVVAVKGTVSAHDASGQTRSLTTDSEVSVGDTVVTGAGSYAVVEFVDGTKATIRPASELLVSKYAYGGPDDGALLELVRGGLRAVTGLIAKKDPETFKVKTQVATLGVRGTEFDIRLCEQTDCAGEAQRYGDSGRGIEGYGYKVLKN